MFLKIVIGVAVGIGLGVVQILVLRKIVGGLADEEYMSPAMMGLAILQMLGTVAVLVLMALYSLQTLLASGLTMILTALITWVMLNQRQVKKGN